MITKEEFTRFIESYQIFEKGLERLSTALTGSKYGISLFETDWGDAVGCMLDTFLDSHFTVEGVDLICWWLFEDVNHIIYSKIDNDLFDSEKEVETDVNHIEDLYNYLIKNGYSKT